MPAEWNDDLEGKDIQQALENWRDSASKSSERPDWFWSRQHVRVMSQIAEKPRSFPKLAWASLAATVAIALSLIFPVHSERTLQKTPQQQPEARHEVQISDHDLMLAVERTLNAGTPSSLEPASLLAEEMNQALVTQAESRKVKESRYEN